MKAVPTKILDRQYVPCAVSEATHIKFHMPGPFEYSILPVITRGTRDKTPFWTWNGDCEFPTLRPSVRIADGESVSHFWMTNGKLHFLTDCTHNLAGQTCELLNVS